MKSAPTVCLLRGAVLVGILLSVVASSRDAWPQQVAQPFRSKVESALTFESDSREDRSNTGPCETVCISTMCQASRSP